MFILIFYVLEQLEMFLARLFRVLFPQDVTCCTLQPSSYWRGFYGFHVMSTFMAL
jgi:hypothetical protein